MAQRGLVQRTAMAALPAVDPLTVDPLDCFCLFSSQLREALIDLRCRHLSRRLAQQLRGPKYGMDAPIHAAQQADEPRDEGDTVPTVLWWWGAGSPRRSM